MPDPKRSDFPPAGRESSCDPEDLKAADVPNADFPGPPSRTAAEKGFPKALGALSLGVIDGPPKRPPESIVEALPFAAPGVAEVDCA